MKRKGPTTSFQAEPIDLDSPPQTQREIGQLSQKLFFGFTLEKNMLPTMDSLYMGHM
jgi:hypothetical protein